MLNYTRYTFSLKDLLNCAKYKIRNEHEPSLRAHKVIFIISNSHNKMIKISVSS